MCIDFSRLLSKCTYLSETSRLVHFKLSQVTAEILETEHNPEAFSLKGRRQGQGDNHGCWGDWGSHPADSRFPWGRSHLQAGAHWSEGGPDAETVAQCMRCGKQEVTKITTFSTKGDLNGAL